MERPKNSQGTTMGIQELKRGTSAIVAAIVAALGPRETASQREGNGLFNLVHQQQPFRFRSLGIPLFILSPSFSLPLPLSLILSVFSIHPSSRPARERFSSYLAPFIFFRSSHPPYIYFTLPPQCPFSRRYDQINPRDRSPRSALLSLASLALSRLGSGFYQRRAFTRVP